MLINSDFDPKTGQIGFFAKGRGIGDCGSSGGYAWTGSGRAHRLQHHGRVPWPAAGRLA